MITCDNKVEGKIRYDKVVETTLMVLPLQMKSQVYTINTLPKGAAKQCLETPVSIEILDIV